MIFAGDFNAQYDTSRISHSTTASDKVYQLLAHGRWLSPGTPASFTTKTGRHDIAEILLKVALSTKNKIKSSNHVAQRKSGLIKQFIRSNSVVPKIMRLLLYKLPLIMFLCLNRSAIAFYCATF